eukprot:GSChrysophyteH1.ASY1.ANO1.2914.1 assembled CDS
MTSEKATFSPIVHEMDNDLEDIDPELCFEDQDLGEPRADALRSDRIHPIKMRSSNNGEFRSNKRVRNTNLKRYPPGTSSVPKAAFNFINSIVGAGIIGMPYAFGECGILGGLLGCMGVAWLVSQSVQMLIECGLMAQILDYEDLAQHLLGKKGYYAALASMFLFAYGAQIAYLVIIGDTIPMLTGAHREMTIASVSFFMILPLSLLKDMSMLSYTSLAAIAADILIIILVVWTAPVSAHSQDIHPSLGHGTLSMFSSRLFAGIGTLSFAFVCMHNSFIVFRSLEVRTEENWRTVSRGSVLFCFVLATIFGFAGYLSFGDRIEGDILNNFIVERKPIDWARAFLAICMIFVYPMEMFVSRHCLCSLMNDIDEKARTSGEVETGTELTSSRHNLISKSGDSTASETSSDDDDDGITETPGDFVRSRENRQHVTVTMIVWFTSTVLAIIFDDLGVVLALTGAVAASCLGYILPGIIYMVSYQDSFQDAWLKAKTSETFWDMTIAMKQFHTPLFMVMFGALVAVFGCITVFTERDDSPGV